MKNEEPLKGTWDDLFGARTARADPVTLGVRANESLAGNLSSSAPHPLSPTPLADEYYITAGRCSRSERPARKRHVRLYI